MKNITWDDFEQVDIRTGTIIEALDFPEARKPAYRLIIDFGDEIGLRKSSAQITNYYSAQELVGKQILAVVNFPPKQIGPWMSECLVLGVTTDEGVVLLATERKVGNGLKVH
ncbi:MAG: hypothetical protein RLZZ262_1030 [Bacteroidota bacterium]|jgi:tRNA-binding protein